MLWLACFPHLCLYGGGGGLRFSIFPLPPRPPLFPPRCQSSLHVPRFYWSCFPSIYLRLCCDCSADVPATCLDTISYQRQRFLHKSEVSSLVALPVVIYIADVLRLHLSAEGCVQARTVAEEIPFGMEFDANLSAVCSLWSHLAVSVFCSEEVPEPLYHPQTWVYIWVSILIHLS